MSKQNLMIALTIDVEPNSTDILERTKEKYTGITKAMPRFLDIATRYKVPVTWFVTHDCWSKIDQEFPSLVEEMNENGEIGCHVHFRRDKETYCTDFEFQMEIVGDATNALRAQGFDVHSFRGGAHFFDENTLRVLKRLDFKVDSSVVPGLFSKIAPDLVVNHRQRFLAKPYFPSFVNHCIPGNSGILEIPLSVCPYFRFQRKLASVVMGKPMSICRPTKSLIKNIERLENDSSKTFGHRIPVVLSAHPFDFLDDIARRIQDFEHFIVETKEALNAEFFTLDQVRKEYVNRTYSFEFTESKFILSSNDLSILPFIRRLLKHF